MRLAKGFKGRYFSLAAIVATVSCVNLQATENRVQNHERQIAQIADHEPEDDAEALEEIVVESLDYPLSEQRSPYPTEIYTRKEIQNSQSIDLYQFLNDHTSVNVSSAYGNRFAPKLDMRGFGIENGYENIVVTVNGRRMNNIDMSSPLLASIPIDTVERIEILKGAGSVEFGDGATAGVINIITSQRSGVEVKGYWGNYGETYGVVDAGYGNDLLQLGVFLDRYANDGIVSSDTSDEKDAQRSRNGNIHLKLTPLEGLELILGYADNFDEIRYAGPIDKESYDEDITKSRSLTEQNYRSKVYSYGASYSPLDVLTFTVDWNRESKTSEYITYGSMMDYWYDSVRARVLYDSPWAFWTVGYDDFDGSRKSHSFFGTNETTKENRGWYFKLDKEIGPHTITAGYRNEKVEYTYEDATKRLNDDDRESAWNIGYNYAYNDTWSGFVSYNEAFQMPDVDRFFVWGGQFNGFIKPMKTHTFNVGVNYFISSDRLKVTLFHIKVDDEIYFNPINYSNTNLQETKKKGVEFYGKHLFTERFWTSASYSYIDSKIEKDKKHPEYEGKVLPGVSKHNLILSCGYRMPFGVSAILSHTYRSSAYALEDFENDFKQKQQSYNSTDLAVNYKRQNLRLFANVTNLFDRKNGLWVRDDAIYPVHYTRTYRFGLSWTY